MSGKERKPAHIKRRHFFRSFMGHTASVIDEVRGIPQHSLNELWTLEPDVLRQIKPLILPNVTIDLSEKHVCAVIQSGKNRVQLFKISPLASRVFNSFDGGTTIGRISELVASTSPMGRDKSFLFTRAFFLHLVKLKVCAPGNVVE